MRFEIPFDEKFSRKDSELIFEIHWKNALKKNKKSLYFIFPFLLLGGLIIYGNNNIGFIFIAMGLYLLYNYNNFLNRYKINRKVHFDNIDKHIEEYLSHNQTIIWEFEDECFCYSDYKYDLKIKWIVFKAFKIIDNTLFLELRDNVTANFALSKEEVGNEDFEKIIAFLESKIKKDGIL